MAVHFPHAGSLGEKADKPSLRLARLQGTMSPPGESGCQGGALVRPVPKHRMHLQEQPIEAGVCSCV